MRRTLSVCLLAALPTLVQAEPPRDQWYTVLLAGRKIGSLHTTRDVSADRVKTDQHLSVSLDRAGFSVALDSDEASEETLDGKPLAFRGTSRMSGVESVISGRVENGRVHLTTSAGADTNEREQEWPVGAVLPEGYRLASLRAGVKPGARVQALAYQPSSAGAVPTTSTVRALESVDLPIGAKRLYHVEQQLDIGGTKLTSQAWIDADQTLYKMVMPILGVELTLLACDKACANAPNQRADVLQQSMLSAPRALARKELARGMRYTLASRDANALTIPNTDEQRVRKEGNKLVVDVLALPMKGVEAEPDADDSAANDWLQSTAPEVVALATQAVGDANSPIDRMRRLETFVRGYITEKNLSVGYASALEVVRKPEGDCTEHAVLLAALGRSLAIPTRVVDGLAYAPGFAGNQQVFVPHAWVQAWVDDRWQSFDAALAGFDAGHIALSYGNGDPWRFYSGLDVLGRVSMSAVEPLMAGAAK